jgi:D-glycero-D-manno-heptose 1,7-bisphosphate phosphatase
MKMREKPATISRPAEAQGTYRAAEFKARPSVASATGYRAVLLDRDGVINSLVYHQDAGIIDSPFTRAQFHLLPRVPQAIRMLNNLGLRVAVVSNQPGIAKGHLKPEILKWFDRTLLTQVQAAGGHIDHIFYCLHHPQAIVPSLRRRCHCRKPQTGLLEQAAAELQVPLSQCYMIGDGIPDMLAGTQAGCRTVFVGKWKCEICQLKEAAHARPAFRADDLWHAAKLIRQELASAHPLRAATLAAACC